MITLARLIESWRDAQIFKEPMKSRGRAWHLLKFPQYGLLIASALTYFVVFYFGPGQEFTLLVVLVRTTFIVAIDIIIAYFVFEFFLEYFRG